jgi:5-methylcytosine-specific restriction endonuclease McrA
MDGKQRLETILHFRYGTVIKDEGKLGFWLRRDESKKREWFYYKDLRNGVNREEFGISVSKFLDYKLPVVEYYGELVGLAGQKIAEKEIFAKINSTGSKLTKNEIRHAQSTLFFEMGDRLESRWKARMVDKWKVFSRSEVARYQYHEFMLELATIVLNQGISDKRRVLDKYMRTDWSSSELKKAEKKVNGVLDWLRKILRDENFVATRFNKKADFYTLFAVLADLKLKRHAVARDAKLDRRARKALIHFSREANKVDSQVKKYLPARLSWQARRYAKYIVATREGTDQMRNRVNRDEVLRPLLEPIFSKRKSNQRLFNLGVKQELWFRSKPRSEKIWCRNPSENPRCAGRMTFDECEVDHRTAYVRGGPSDDPRNAQLLCKSCNRRKGARRR